MQSTGCSQEPIAPVFAEVGEAAADGLRDGSVVRLAYDVLIHHGRIIEQGRLEEVLQDSDSLEDLFFDLTEEV